MYKMSILRLKHSICINRFPDDTDRFAELHICINISTLSQEDLS